MEKLQLKTDRYTLYGPDSLREIIKPSLHVLDRKIIEYCDLFDIDEFRAFSIYLFDDIDEFREHIKILRNGVNLPPDYATGTFDNGDIHLFINPEKYDIDNLAHELFHIMYKELILERQNKPRIVWYDEGMAQMLSGQRHENDEDYFKEFYLLERDKTKTLPEDINIIKHRSGTFKTADYDGYNLGYICVMYLREILSEDEFKEVLHDPDIVETIGKTVLNDAIDYYNRRYKPAQAEGTLDMSNDQDRKIAERINKEKDKYIPMIKEAINKCSNDDELAKKLEECLIVLENPDSSIGELRENLVIVENKYLDFYLQEKRKGSK